MGQKQNCCQREKPKAQEIYTPNSMIWQPCIIYPGKFTLFVGLKHSSGRNVNLRCFLIKLLENFQPFFSLLNLYVALKRSLWKKYVLICLKTYKFYHDSIHFQTCKFIQSYAQQGSLNVEVNTYIVEGIHQISKFLNLKVMGS